MAVIIYPPTIDWAYMRQRPQNLMFEFARNGHQVFYCNKSQQKYPCFEKITENLNIVNNLDLFQEKYLPVLKASGAPIIVWCSWALLANTLKEYKPDLIVYDCLDEFADWLPYEPDMVRIADLIFCTSDHLMQRMAAQYPEKKIFLLNNGCDCKIFSPDINSGMPKPTDLPETTGARIGYIGAWAWWVDVELIKKICSVYPRHQVVVIGPDLGAELPRNYPNFVYLGLKPYEQLPKYMAFLDICIIPFKINATTIATNPIKAYEYLAAGKKVISTALPEAAKMQPLVRIASSHEEFLEQIWLCLETGHENLEQMRIFAEENSWEKRYLQIEQVLSGEVTGFHQKLSFNIGGYDHEEAGFLLFYPAADVTISSSKPQDNRNFYPACIGRKNDAIHRYLLSFNMHGISGDINRAVLSVFIEKCDRPDKLKCIEIRKIIGGWREKLTTWKTRPATDRVPVTWAAFKDANGWLEWDITDLVKEWAANPATNLGIELKGNRDTLPFQVLGVNRHRNDCFIPKLKIYLSDS